MNKELFDEKALQIDVLLIEERKMILEILKKHFNIGDTIKSNEKRRTPTLFELVQLEYIELNDLINTLKIVSSIKYEDGDREKISEFEAMRVNLETKYPELLKRKKKNK